MPTTGFVTGYKPPTGLVGAITPLAAGTPSPPLPEHAPASLAPPAKTAPVLHCPFSNSGVAEYGSVEGGLRRTVNSLLPKTPKESSQEVWPILASDWTR